MPNKPLYAFFGHHKCATMWLNRIISIACRKLGLRFQAVYDHEGFGGDLRKFVAAGKVDFLSYGNVDMNYVTSVDVHRGFHIIRDPRDIVVSAYFSHLHSHSTEGWPALKAHRERLQSLTKDDGLALEIENRASEFRHLSDWDYDQPHILEIRFEDVTATSYEYLLNIFRHLDLLDEQDDKWRTRARTLLLEVFDYFGFDPASSFWRRLRPGKLPGAEILAIGWRNRFQSQTGGRIHGEEDVTSHYRKGLPGDWLNHFTVEHKTLFKDRYPGLVASLGYSNSDNW